MIQSAEIHEGEILIVDDQDSNVILLERMLRGAGYQSVTTTMDPTFVRALHAQEGFDLTLLDLQMPDMDGFQVMDALKQDAPSDYLPVLVITAQPDQKLRALKAGAKDFVIKQGSLTPDEWDLMKGHPLMGSKILGNSASPYIQMAAEIALNHHERWDGSGYPSGKPGKAIPLSARIMNLCDIYDALRSKRPYKPGLDHPRALEIITQGDGRILPGHFDPEILILFQRHHATFRATFHAHTA